MGKFELNTYAYNLKLKDTFTISYGSRDIQPTLIIAITEGAYTGYGEAAATSYYGVSVEEMRKKILNLKDLIRENIELSPEELWELTNPYLKEDHFAQCALDMALHDLHGKRNHLPLYKLWGLNLDNIALTNYTIGIASLEEMIRKIKAFPWPIYKIKLGTPNDVEIIKELRKHTNAIFRVDANASWTLEEAISNSKALKELNVEFLEQPLRPDDFEGLKKLYQESSLPLMADESCIIEEDVANCAQYFHGVNIKLTKCGGITPAKRMIQEARGLGLKVMVGCMTESSVGISAIAQLLPLLDYVDMDGALLLKEDIADGVKIHDSKVFFPNRNGTGVKLL